MKKKKLFPVLLSLGLALGMSGVTTLSFPTGASAEVKDQAKGEIDISGSAKTINVKVSPGYGHLKIQLINRGKSDVKVNLKHKKTKEYYIEDEVIKPGKTLNWISNDYYPDGVGAGDYNLSLSSGEKPLKVYYAYKAADDKW